MCCNPWGHKELDMTEQPNGTKLNQYLSSIYHVSVSVHHAKYRKINEIQSLFSRNLGSMATGKRL